MTLERKIIKKSFLPDIISAFFIFGYSLITGQIPLETYGSIFILLIPLLIILQFVFAPVTDHLLYTGVSKRVEKFEQEETTENERTELLEAVHHLPFTAALQTFVYFIVGSAIILWICYSKLDIHLNVCILLMMEYAFGSYVASMLADNYCRRICNTYAVKIIQKGVNADYVKQKKFFGNSMLTEMLIFLVLPIIFTSIISVIIVVIGYYPADTIERAGTQINRMLFTAVLNIIIQLILISSFYMTMYMRNKKVAEVLHNMVQSNDTNFSLLETDLANEVSLSHYLINNMILLFRHTLNNAGTIANEINDSSAQLLKISNETETTSVEQSTGTKEIVSTMQDISRLSSGIEKNIIQVADLAENTVQVVTKGADLLASNLEKMELISKTGQETIYDIQNLNEKVNSIREITNIINSIADQTKIIAFNAELEATNVHDENRSFKNVSSEIRRLANSTMDSTREIKNKIAEIQSSSEELIKSSLVSTNLITKGSALADELRNKFSNIKFSAEKNSSSASEIKYLINQQNSAFEHIVKTLQQINTSIQSFSESTRTIIDTADVLRKSVGTLEQITHEGGDKK